MGWRHKRELEEINCHKTEEELQVQVSLQLQNKYRKGKGVIQRDRNNAEKVWND